MNFYPHHIGDYLTATAHLTWLEDCAYRRLLDVYYSRERAIPSDMAQACRLVRATSKDERRAVETVLSEFFAHTTEGWKHGRCDEEIQKASDAAERARRNGRNGGRPPKTKPTVNPEITQSVPVGNPEKSNSKAPNPITNTNTSESKDSGDKPPKLTDPNEIIFGYGVPMLTAAGTDEKQARSFLGMLRKQHTDQIVVDKLRECAKAKPLQPLEWLAAALPPKASGKHAGFETKNYREGVTADGSLT